MDNYSMVLTVLGTRFDWGHDVWRTIGVIDERHNIWSWLFSHYSKGIENSHGPTYLSDAFLVDPASSVRELIGAFGLLSIEWNSTDHAVVKFLFAVRDWLDNKEK